MECERRVASWTVRYLDALKESAGDVDWGDLIKNHSCQSSNMNLSSKKNSSGGFTLIELLVVIAIIGLLSSVVLASLNSARGKARDTSRKANLRQLQNALELYFDNNNSYPATPGVWYTSEPGDPNSTNGGNWIPGLAPTYISTLPRDPRGGVSTNPICAPGGYTRSYYYYSNGANFWLLAHCSQDNTWTSSDPFYTPFLPTWGWLVCGGPVGCTTWP